MITIKDIARSVGVAASTVARALADHPHVHEATKARIREEAARLGYVAHAPARAMRGGHSGLIGLLIPDVRNDFYSTAAQAISGTCGAAGLQVVLSITDEDPARERDLLRGLVSARCAGIIVVLTAAPLRESFALLQKIPHVQFIRRSRGLRAPWFGIDDAATARLATQHLLRLGHRRIAYVGGNLALSTGGGRFQGFTDTLKAHRIALRQAGGLTLKDGTQLIPDLLLVGRDAERVQRLAASFGMPDAWSTDLAAALADDRYAIYFDGVTTALRPGNLRQAIAAGKHVYCEKPIAESAAEAAAIAALATAGGIRHGVVHDKLWAPGMAKLGLLARSGFFGRILSVRIDGCYWVFEGDLQPIQRPSWNYRANEGGGMILDMMPHYRYMLESIVAPIRRMVCHGATHVHQRWDERGKPYVADADDACYAILELDGGIVAQIMSSWCVRVRRDDIITMQIDGTAGSAVAGLSHCWIQPQMATPKAQWALDAGKPVDFRADWQLVPETQPYVNAFRAQWEAFLRHVVEDAPFPWTLESGARGVALAEKALVSSREGRWVDV